MKKIEALKMQSNKAKQAAHIAAIVALRPAVPLALARHPVVVVPLVVAHALHRVVAVVLRDVHQAVVVDARQDARQAVVVDARQDARQAVVVDARQDARLAVVVDARQDALDHAETIVLHRVQENAAPRVPVYVQVSVEQHAVEVVMKNV